MATWTYVQLGANGLAHSWAHVSDLVAKLTTLFNTTKFEHDNLKDDGIRTSNIRAHNGKSISGRLLVRNATGSTIAADKIVYISGTYAGTVSYPSVALADAHATKATHLLGLAVVEASISNNADGTAVLVYEFSGVNTSGATVGDPVYLSTTAGGWTLTRGTSDELVQVVGVVTVVHASTGRWIFNPGLGEKFLFGAAGGLGIWLDADQDSGIHATADGVVKLKIEGTDRWESDTSGHWMPTSDRGVNIGQTAKRVGTVFTSALEIKTTDAADGVVKNILELEWDPQSGNMSDNTSGIGINFKMPDDGNVQSVYATIASMVVSDVAGSEEGELGFWVLKSGTNTETVTLSSAAFAPATTDNVSLGTAALNFSDLFLDSGAVVNFDSGNVTVTHSSGKLALVGGLDVGVDGTGHDVKLFGDTSGKYLLWDQSEDLAVLQGSLVVGHTALDGITSSEPHIQIHNTGNPAFGAFRWADSAYGPINYMGKSRSGTIGTHALVENGDILGEIKFLGDDASDFNSVSASIGAAIDKAPGDNDMPGRLVFSTTADGAVAPTERMRIDSSGAVTKPTNPAFLSHPSGTLSNVTGDGTAYTVVFATEVFDQGSDATSTTFTAPVTGRYQINVSLGIAGLTSSTTVVSLNIVTTNRTFNVGYANPYACAGAGTDFTMPASVIADLDASDTAHISISVHNGAKVVDLTAASFFSACLLT